MHIKMSSVCKQKKTTFKITRQKARKVKILKNVYKEEKQSNKVNVNVNLNITVFPINVNDSNFLVEEKDSLYFKKVWGGNKENKESLKVK